MEPAIDRGDAEEIVIRRIRIDQVDTPDCADLAWRNLPTAHRVVDVRVIPDDLPIFEEVLRVCVEWRQQVAFGHLHAGLVGSLSAAARIHAIIATGIPDQPPAPYCAV